MAIATIIGGISVFSLVTRGRLPFDPGEKSYREDMTFTRNGMLLFSLFPAFCTASLLAILVEKDAFEFLPIAIACAAMTAFVWRTAVKHGK